MTLPDHFVKVEVWNSALTTWGNQRSGYYVVKQMTMIKKMMQRSLVFLFDKLELDEKEEEQLSSGDE